jgi:hypothetical protein
MDPVKKRGLHREVIPLVGVCRRPPVENEGVHPLESPDSFCSRGKQTRELMKSRVVDVYMVFMELSFSS